MLIGEAENGLGIENSESEGRMFLSISFSLPLIKGGPSVIFLPALPAAHGIWLAGCTVVSHLHIREIPGKKEGGM